MCWDCYANKGGDPYKDFRRGKVEIEDFDDEMPYRKAPHGKAFEWSNKATRRARINKRPGCPENDMKAHLYVWTTELESEKTLFFRYFGFHKYQREVCCGCGKHRKTENTERYIKRKDRAWEKMNDLFAKGEPVPRWGRWGGVKYSYFTWENYNEEWWAFRKEEIAKENDFRQVDVDGRWLLI